MQYVDTKFAIIGSIQRFAAMTSSEIQNLHDDFDDMLVLSPDDVPVDIKSRFELISYVNAPGEPIVHVHSTQPQRIHALARFLCWLKVTPEDIVCETTFVGAPVVEIDRLRALMRTAVRDRRQPDGPRTATSSSAAVR